MKPNMIEDITNFIFVGKSIEQLQHYDLLIINADYAEESVANDLRIMFDKNIIDKDTVLIVCDSHGQRERSSADILINYKKKKGLENKIIIDRKYITNPEILKNLDKLVDINKFDSILRVAKDFVARRWFMNANNYNFPVEKCDFYGVIDGRNISKNDWYKSDGGIKQVMKEFVNIGQQTIDGELSIK